jgi:transcription antitermination factor NusG
MQHWFAIYTLSRHEKRVAQHFQMQQIEHFLPLYMARQKWKDGTKHDIQFPLFPNYLFVRITRKKRASVLAIPGVLLIVGGGNESFSVSDNYMQSLRDKVTQGGVEPHPYLATGEMVRIKSGAMAGMEGVLVRRKSGFRVVVTLELIKRSVAVEFDIADLEPCRPLSLSCSGTGIVPAA